MEGVLYEQNIQEMVTLLNAYETICNCNSNRDAEWVQNITQTKEFPGMIKSHRPFISTNHIYK